MKEACLPTQPESYDAFISYRHQTGFYLAELIFTKLISKGFSVYMDKKLTHGEYEPQIHEALKKSKNFIMVLFPEDLKLLQTEKGKTCWLEKEAQWACQVAGINKIPVFADNCKKSDEMVLPAGVKNVLGNQGLDISKGYAMDAELEELCGKRLQNTNPLQQNLNTHDFFHACFAGKPHLQVKQVDLAFHAGGSWLRASPENTVLKKMLENKIPVRVLINTPAAAKSVTKHMHDNSAIYCSFREAQSAWKLLSRQNPDVLQVRVCSVPLMRVHHGVTYQNGEAGDDRIRVRYYVYDNTRLDQAFVHVFSPAYPTYALYQKEFEYLWANSKPL